MDGNHFIYGAGDNYSDGGQSGKEHNPKSRTILTVILAAAAVGLIVLIFFLVNRGYSVKNVIINGVSPYSEEILLGIVDEYCEDKNTRSFFYINAGELTDLFYDSLPYIKSVKAEKKFPDTLIITIEGETPRFYFEIYGGCYILSPELKVLEKHDGIPNAETISKITFPDPKEITVGKTLVFSDESLISDEDFKRFYNSLKDAGIAESISELCVTNRFELSFTFRSGVDVYVGSIKDVEEKIKGLTKWINENRDELSPNVNIDVSILKKIVISRD